MKLFRQENSKLYALYDLSEDYLIAHFNVCINYRAYLQSLITLPDKQLLAFAPGKSAAEVRDNLKGHIKACNDYIDMWKTSIETGQDKKQN